MRRTILPLLLVVAMAGVSNADQTATGAGGAITDIATPTDSTATIAASETISTVDITLFGLAHTWAGDLIVTLTSPGATELTIMSGVGDPGNVGFGDSSNFGGDYSFSNGGGDLWMAAADAPTTDDIVAPGNYFASDIDGLMLSFDVFGGEDAVGDWTLSITDRAGGDDGSFDSWEVRVNRIPEPSSLMLVALAGMVGFVRRRRA